PGQHVGGQERDERDREQRRQRERHASCDLGPHPAGHWVRCSFPRRTMRVRSSSTPSRWFLRTYTFGPWVGISSPDCSFMIPIASPNIRFDSASSVELVASATSWSNCGFVNFDSGIVALLV